MSARMHKVSLLLVSVLACLPGPERARAQTPAVVADAGVVGASADDGQPAALPEGHEPRLRVELTPKDGVSTGELVHLRITATIVHGDDIALPEQSFAPYEVHAKNLRVTDPVAGKQDYVFDLKLLALLPGEAPIPSLELRVVTKDGFVGRVTTDALPYKVRSRLANEPNAETKPETKPVSVMEDNFIPIYVALALLFALAVVGLTLLVSRYLQKRREREAPPPPPRPPWEVAVEKLAELERKKLGMLEQGEGGAFVDQVSDVVREYLGGRYAFDGLETTTDEMIALLKRRGAALQLTQDVFAFLSRCDLVKFAKVIPDRDEADLVFAKAYDLVHGSRPPVVAAPIPSGTGPEAGAK